MCITMKILIILFFVALIGNSITDGIDWIDRAFKTRDSRKINLSRRGITHQGVRCIVRSLNENPHITSLDLSYNEIGREGIAAILDASKTTAIVDLNLSHNTEPEWLNHIFFAMKVINTVKRGNHLSLATALNNTKMNYLSLAGNWINEQDALNIAKVLSNTKITSLDLGQNRIGSVGGAAIINALGTEMIFLSLRNNNIRGREAILLGNALKYTRLTSLDLSENSIENDGIAAIANVLRDTNIIHLNLQSNRINSEGASALINVLPNTLITFLGMRNNDIKNEKVFYEISITLRENRFTIHQLYHEFVNLVSVEKDHLQFSSAEPLRCRNFTTRISGKKQGYISHFTAHEDSRFTRYQVEEFIGNIETKLSYYLSSKIGEINLIK